MKRDTIIIISTSLALSVVVVWGMLTNHQGRMEAVAAKVEASNWMADTTGRLEAINGKLEALTADTIALSMEVDALADRMERAGI